MLRPYRGIVPQVAQSAYVDPSAQLIGEVVVGERASVWPNVSVRAEYGPIVIGEESNVQDNSVLHMDEGIPLVIGKRVTVGHSVVLHGCVVEDDCVVGIGAVVLNGVRLGAGSVVAAGAVVPEGMVVPPGSMLMGVPAKVRREVGEDEKRRFAEGVKIYVHHAAEYLEQQGS
jgi:gamma-carbonic anhydrase